jgi:hypothetical protein
LLAAVGNQVATAGGKIAPLPSCPLHNLAHARARGHRSPPHRLARFASIGTGYRIARPIFGGARPGTRVGGPPPGARVP